MPVKTMPAEHDAKYYCISYGRNILLQKNALAGKDVFDFLIKNNKALDWFTEDPLSYAAMLLKEDLTGSSILPKDCTFTPVRQLFFDNEEISPIAARALSLLRQRESFKYCPTCASLLQDDKDETAKLCTKCNKKFFPRIEPATITLVSKGSQILLAKNKNAIYKNYACISGFVEQGETLEQCVAREVKEETNIDVQNVRYVGSQAWPFPDQLMLAFTADYKAGQIKIQESELTEAAWFEKDALPPQDQLPRPGSVAWNLISGKFNN